MSRRPIAPAALHRPQAVASAAREKAGTSSVIPMLPHRMAQAANDQGMIDAINQRLGETRHIDIDAETARAAEQLIGDIAKLIGKAIIVVLAIVSTILVVTL